MPSSHYLVFLLSPFICVANAVNVLNVDTYVGTITGFSESASPNVAQFLGIPWAEPPVGRLRWKPPVPNTNLGTFKATGQSPACPQYVSRIQNVYNTDVPQFNINPDEWSEDCLTLNIWAPYFAGNNSDGEPLPVIVWIYGGGFNNGGGNIAYQIPTNWIQRSQEHIVVGINYRVNIFGFPNSAALPLTEQNLGLLDQRAALEWVRSNIAAFGGDPSRITIWVSPHLQPSMSALYS
jgi:acetylcholinesterase